MNTFGNMVQMENLLGVKGGIMEYKDFVERVSWGEEFPFDIAGKGYWISHSEHGYHLSHDENDYQDFKTAEELFKNAEINGKTLLELWDVICDQI